ncbi:hypothetical protein [Winogradskya humida]|uniref:Uncharacterized protein n=1 Tax=Winogradskya humida TaxID=113566 RepID=A0ABQ3ZHM1_9ACTN|nr:hypothetical protein [Actinoplanes humidus]GIE18070.1 hypothetical protein Ahu01nite_011720 [Actinoplanes humidus]
MNIEIVEGRLAETSGTQRRAFGEFAGPHGELASYAFGWTTGDEPRVATLTIGIGAGNPGGGTFHAVLSERGLSLTDEPFERVPQGGPDLTAEQARAHEDLPFVWWVADQVMERDRRAQWMRHWVLGTSVIQTLEVSERREPVLLISHDADDGMWQLIGTTSASVSTGRIGHLHHAVDHDRTLLDVLALPPGHSATRSHVGGTWTRQEDSDANGMSPPSVP